MRCVTCCWWDRARPGVKFGLCRVEPPRPEPPRWPQTDEQDWCGRYTEGTSYGEPSRREAGK